MDEQRALICEHRWRYWVNLESKAVTARECERCGLRAVVPTRLEQLPGRPLERQPA